MDFDKLFQKKFKQQFDKNLLQVQIDVNKNPLPKYLKIKIKNESIKKQFNENDIIENIKINKLYASFFCKNPLKQNLAEKTQYIILKSLREKEPNGVLLKPKFPDIKKCNLYLHKGKLVNQKLNMSKSIDFVSESTNTYFCCKYINEYGGSQDNQYNDIKLFLNECKNIKNTNINICLVLNGKYFTKNKILELRKIYNFINIKL